MTSKDELSISYSTGEFFKGIPEPIVKKLTLSTDLYLREIIRFLVKTEITLPNHNYFRESYSLTPLPEIVSEALISRGVNIVRSSQGFYYLEWKRKFYIPFE